MKGTVCEGKELKRSADREDFLMEEGVQGLLLLLVELLKLAQNQTCITQFFEQLIEARRCAFPQRKGILADKLELRGWSETIGRHLYDATVSLIDKARYANHVEFVEV